jgi:hypothetical protein
MSYNGDVDFMQVWKSWRELAEAIKEGRKYGLTDEETKAWATEVGPYLATNVCAGTAEEVLLKKLWDIASDDEGWHLANLIFRLAGKLGKRISRHRLRPAAPLLRARRSYFVSTRLPPSALREDHEYGERCNQTVTSAS